MKEKSSGWGAWEGNGAARERHFFIAIFIIRIPGGLPLGYIMSTISRSAACPNRK